MANGENGAYTLHVQKLVDADIELENENVIILRPFKVEKIALVLISNQVNALLTHVPVSIHTGIHM